MKLQDFMAKAALSFGSISSVSSFSADEGLRAIEEPNQVYEQTASPDSAKSHVQSVILPQAHE